MNLIKIFAYNFGKIISKKPKLFLFLISIGSLLFILILSFLKYIFAVSEEPFYTVFSDLLNISLSPSLVLEGSLIVIIINIIAAVIGLLFLGALIGMISSIIESKISDLKRGKSVVIENNHSIFLGWSNKLRTAIIELSESNRSMAHSSIVILAAKDKVFMEEELIPEIPHWSKTDVICRSGDPSYDMDLRMVSVSTARSIVLLSTEDVNSDSIILKRSLALQKDNTITCPIIAEVHSAENAEAIKLLDKFTVIQPKNFIMRVIAQTIKEPGLSKLYYELLSFRGKEFYIWPPTHDSNDSTSKSNFAKNFVGKTFKEIVFNFSSSSVIGIASNEEKDKKEIKILPDFSTIIKDNDQLILISEDDSTIGKMKGIYNPLISNPQIQTTVIKEPKLKKHVTIIGWNSWTHILIEELNAQLEKGSEIDILFNDKIKHHPDELFSSKCQNLKITIKPQKTSNKEYLSQVNWTKTNSVIILSYRDDFEIQEADSLTLMTFTHIKSHRDTNQFNFNICCELLDPKNQRLIEGNRDDEFITGEELIAMYLVQLSENKYLKEVYTDLLDDSGAEFYLRSASTYLNNLDSEVTFGELVNEGLKRNEIVIGIHDRKYIDDITSFKSILSPEKFSKFKLGPEDKILVIAHD
jgi:Trk K+ transport system NAD-binding subunit